MKDRLELPRVDSAATPRGPPAAPALLAELVRRVVALAKLDRIILFGSAARGELGPDSDLDLLVIKSGVEHRRRLAEAIYMNLSGIEVPVDIVVATPEDVERYGGRVGSVIAPALREGEEIYVRLSRETRPIRTSGCGAHGATWRGPGLADRRPTCCMTI